MSKDTSYSKKLTLVYLQELFRTRTDKTHFVRMPEILDYLAERGVYVDRRTIYTDLTLLDYADFEVKGVQERGGYKYHHIKRKFDTNELKILVDSVAASKFLTQKKSNELIAKIKSLGSIYDESELNRNILLGKRIKSMNDKVLNNLDIIHYAINYNEQLSFLYMKWNPKKELEYVRKGETYIVSPFAVTINDDNYYMIAFDHKNGDLRHYRIDKMKSIKRIQEPREGKEHFKNFDIVDYNKKTFGMFSGEEATIQLQFKANLAGVFIDRFGKDIPIREDFQNKGYYLTRISVNVSPQFFAWLFGLGKDVKIISPDSVKEKYLKAVQDISSLYNP